MANPTTDSRIWQAIKAQVKVVSNGLPIAWPGEPFEAAGPFLAVSEVMAPAERRSLRGADPHRLRGSLMMRLSVPLTDRQAPEVWRERAGQIAAAFPADLWLEFQGQRVRVRERASVTNAYQDVGWIHWVVQARWETMA